MQARFLEVFRDAFDPSKSGYVAGLNPISEVTGERMVDLDHMHVYCWDARPYPAFPYATSHWSDGVNWLTGHWLNGRLGSSSLDRLVAQILTDQGFEEFDASGLAGTVPGYVIDRTMSARDAIQPLELAYFFDSIESEGRVVFRHRGRAAPALAVDADGLVEDDAEQPLYQLTRGQETELPASAKLRYISGGDVYHQAVAEARRLTGASGRVSEADLPIVLDDSLAGAIAESWLYETWAARESASFKLPPSALALEPGDTVSIDIAGRSRLVRLTDVSEHGVREIEALSIDPDVYDLIDAPPRAAPQPAPVQAGPPALMLMDLPLWNATADEQLGYAAALQAPWPGSVAIYESPQTTGYQRGSRGGALASSDLVTVLGGANVAALRNAIGDWEIIQFSTATLVDVQTYALSGLLRGQFGTESAIANLLPAGAPFVLLDGAVARIALRESELSLPFNWRYGPGNRDIGDASYVTMPFTFLGLGLRPLSPARVTGERTAGDLSISWIRRTRSGGDNWEPAEVPLGEDTESYEVDILDGEVVQRTIATAAPSAVYTSAEQTADFGGPQATVSVKVYQTNGRFGRGTPRAAVL